MSISIKWLGHASFQITTDNKVIYLDPYEGECKEGADIILVSHSHHDHCDAEKIRGSCKDNTIVIAPPDCASGIGRKIKSLKPDEKHSIENITIKAVEAYNYKRFRSPGNPFHPKGLGVGYLVTIGDKTIYHAGDTDFIPEMKNLTRVNIALLPSGGTYTMDNQEVVEAALTIRPEFVIPMHRWDTNPLEVKEKIEGRSEIKVVILQPGERFELN